MILWKLFLQYQSFYLSERKQYFHYVGLQKREELKHQYHLRRHIQVFCVTGLHTHHALVISDELACGTSKNPRKLLGFCLYVCNNTGYLCLQKIIFSVMSILRVKCTRKLTSWCLFFSLLRKLFHSFVSGSS